MSQHALSDLVKRIVLDVARNDHRVGVSHVGYVHAFLLELRQRIQYRDHLSLESGEARALLRRTRALLRRHGGVRVVDEIDDDILDLALELPEYVHESLRGGRCVLSFEELDARMGVMRRDGKLDESKADDAREEEWEEKELQLSKAQHEWMDGMYGCARTMLNGNVEL